MLGMLHQWLQTLAFHPVKHSPETFSSSIFNLFVWIIVDATLETTDISRISVLYRDGM